MINVVTGALAHPSKILIRHEKTICSPLSCPFDILREQRLVAPGPEVRCEEAAGHKPMRNSGAGKRRYWRAISQIQAGEYAIQSCTACSQRTQDAVEAGRGRSGLGEHFLEAKRPERAGVV